jgi:hypothetical protein
MALKDNDIKKEYEALEWEFEVDMLGIKAPRTFPCRDSCAIAESKITGADHT